jgi:hypothetical protein
MENNAKFILDISKLKFKVQKYLQVCDKVFNRI